MEFVTHSGVRCVALKEKKNQSSPAPTATDVDLKLEAGCSLGLSLDMRSIRVHSRHLTTVLITDAAKRWKKSSVCMSLALTKGYFFLPKCLQSVTTTGNLDKLSDGARASRGNRSRVDFIDVILLIYAAVKGGGGDLKRGEGREKKEPGSNSVSSEIWTC